MHPPGHARGRDGPRWPARSTCRPGTAGCCAGSRPSSPSARLGAGDIDHDGVDFCAATFGATPVYGREDPADVEIDAPYELIWCGSLFTHLPPERWEGFLALFERALAPGGLLVFTTHGRRIAERIRDPETGGAVPEGAR